MLNGIKLEVWKHQVAMTTTVKTQTDSYNPSTEVFYRIFLNHLRSAPIKRSN